MTRAVADSFQPSATPGLLCETHSFSMTSRTLVRPVGAHVGTRPEGHSAVVSMSLIESGADVNARSKGGLTAALFDRFARLCHPAVRLLVKGRRRTQRTSRKPRQFHQMSTARPVSDANVGARDGVNQRALRCRRSSGGERRGIRYAPLTTRGWILHALALDTKGPGAAGG
jgi:hypothetical protein